MNRALLPHEYRYVWELLQWGPLAAGEIAGGVNMRGPGAGSVVANQLRPLRDRGWVKVDSVQGVNIYAATRRAREAVTW